jgi:flagellar motor switch protein FliM
MNKILSQEEIDAILAKAVCGEGEKQGVKHRVIEPCNFRNTNQMSEPYARFMANLYEGFARSASNSLGAYLRAHFEMALSLVELMPVRDFLAGFQETGFIALLSLQPAGSSMLMQVDPALVFPIIDVLLGGFGTPTPKSREMTEIDQDIMEGVAQIICRQLESAWHPTGFTIRVDGQQKAAQVEKVYSPTEKLTVLRFIAKVNETTGLINLSLPAALAGAMMRQISSDPRREARLGQQACAGLQDRVMDCDFCVTLGLPNLRIPLRELVALKPGSVLDLRRSVRIPVSLILGGREYFVAAPVRSGKQRAAQLLRPADDPTGTEE